MQSCYVRFLMSAFILNLTLLSDASDQSRREATSSHTLYTHTLNTYTATLSTTGDTVEELSAKLTKDTLSREREAVTYREMEGRNKDLRALVDRYRGQLEDHKIVLNKMRIAHEKEINALKATLASIPSSTPAQRVPSLALPPPPSTSSDAHLRQEISDIAAKLISAEAQAASLQQALISNELKASADMEAIRDKYAAMIQQIESKLQTEVDAKHSLGGVVHRLQGQLKELEEDKDEMTYTHKTLEGKLRGLRAEAEAAEATVRELSAQLMASQAAREEGIYSSVHAML